MFFNSDSPSADRVMHTWTAQSFNKLNQSTDEAKQKVLMNGGDVRDFDCSEACLVQLEP